MVVGWADGFAQSENQMVKASSSDDHFPREGGPGRHWKTLEDCKTTQLTDSDMECPEPIIEASSIGLGLKAVQISKGPWYYLVLLGTTLSLWQTMAQYCSFYLVIYRFITGSVVQLQRQGASHSAMGWSILDFPFGEQG